MLNNDILVKIYKPTKSAMQSGVQKYSMWKVEFCPANTKYVEPLMQWIGSKDTRQQIHLLFTTKEQAIAYAEKNNFKYILLQERPLQKNLNHMQRILQKLKVYKKI
ncbi:NADH dehydrogenase ubiquinone Fe-S protein 4 [Neoehrlichia mikurensis]|uniref:NADH dehydrogenase ubiquinone Fe-S protein 4 n=1 Tax=Neoehrlichia mikurensis TaxID=89586 RepID=UPI001FEBA032|nr:NADH dehydrogenase ubiquinone Fe-S protein 4 [Neoehrlichia mikurensis]